MGDKADHNKETCKGYAEDLRSQLMKINKHVYTRTQQVTAKMEAQHDKMLENLQAEASRRDHIDINVKVSEDMQEGSVALKQKASRLSRILCCKSYTWLIVTIIVSIVALAAGVLVLYLYFKK